MKYLHTMVRVTNLEKSLAFYRDGLGLQVTQQKEYPAGKFTLVFLASQNDIQEYGLADAPKIELTYNWEPETYTGGRNFGHLAFQVENIYMTCEKLSQAGVVINRPPRDGRMAFVRSPDNISIELLQKGKALEIIEPWSELPNIGVW